VVDAADEKWFCGPTHISCKWFMYASINRIMPADWPADRALAGGQTERGM